MPDPLDMSLEMADAAAVAKELRTLLRQALPRLSSPLPLTLQAQSLPVLSDKARTQLATMGIRLGDCVVIAGQKVCIAAFSVLLKAVPRFIGNIYPRHFLHFKVIQYRKVPQASSLGPGD